jgi:hypothetical protein
MTAAASRGRVLDLDRIVGLADARATAMRSHAQITVKRWGKDDPRGFNVAIVTPEKLSADEPVIFPMSYDYRIEPLVLRRLEVIAVVSGRRIVAVETPGVTVDFDDPARTAPSSVASAEARAGILGDYTGLAALQLQAIADVTGIVPSGSRFLGESLGAQAVMSMSEGFEPRSIDLIEPVNCVPQGPIALLRLGRTLGTVEEPLRSRYVARSIEQGWSIPEVFEKSSPTNAEVDRRLKRFDRQGRWATLSALAMRRGLLRSVALIGPATPIRIWRGAESTASKPKDIRRFIIALLDNDRRAEWLTLKLDGMPAGHHILTDLDAATGFALELRRFWDAE